MNTPTQEEMKAVSNHLFNATCAASHARTDPSATEAERDFLAEVESRLDEVRRMMFDFRG